MDSSGALPAAARAQHGAHEGGVVAEGGEVQAGEAALQPALVLLPREPLHARLVEGALGGREQQQREAAVRRHSALSEAQVEQ